MLSNSFSWNSVQFKATLLINVAVCPWLPLFKKCCCVCDSLYSDSAFLRLLHLKVHCRFYRQLWLDNLTFFTLLEWLSFIKLQFAIWSVLKRDKEELRLRNSPEAVWPFYPAFGFAEGRVLVISKTQTFVFLNSSARNALFIMFLLGVFKCAGCQLDILSLTQKSWKENRPHTPLVSVISNSVSADLGVLQPCCFDRRLCCINL